MSNDNPTPEDATPASWKHALIMAFMFLTRLPMPKVANMTARDRGLAASLFPVVGLVLGIILAVLAVALLKLLPAMIVAAVILITWVLLTGALHLDGLGDSADGWLSGASPERALEIMRDPRCGSAAVTAINAVLLLKFAALASLLEQGIWQVLLIVPLLGRTASIWLLLITPYVRKDGIARDFIDYASDWTLLGGFILSTLLTALVLGPISAVCLGALLILVFWLLRRLMIQRLQGATGDTSGALCEILEAVTLVVCCALPL